MLAEEEEEVEVEEDEEEEEEEDEEEEEEEGEDSLVEPGSGLAAAQSPPLSRQTISGCGSGLPPEDTDSAGNQPNKTSRSHDGETPPSPSGTVREAGMEDRVAEVGGGVEALTIREVGGETKPNLETSG